MRFDEATKTFELSVRDLAEEEGFRRIGSDGMDAWVRFGAGADLHARVLSQRRAANPLYQGETHVRAETAIEDWKAIITGRIDGCVREPDRTWLLEEFKSVLALSPGFRPPDEAFRRHSRQLLFYCHLWDRLGNTPVRASLIYVDLRTCAERAYALHYDRDEQEHELQLRLAELLGRFKESLEGRRRKASVAARLPFPHESPRPGQETLMRAVSIAVQQREHLLAEAPTGLGKTAGVIYPALRDALSSSRQLIFLTAKTLQQNMAVNVLKKLNGERAFRTIQIRAKEKMCANGQVLCHEDFCPYAKSYPQKMERSGLLGRFLEGQAHWDPDTVFADAKEHEVCPFEVQLELASRADAIVADYNYVFDPGVALRHLDEMSSTLLLVDEAHNVPDRARKIFSPELTETLVREARSACNAFAGTLPGRAARRHRTPRRPRAEQTAFAFGAAQPVDPSQSGSAKNTGEGGLFSELGVALDAMQRLLVTCAESLEGRKPVAEIEPPVAGLREVWRDWEAAFIGYVLWKRDQKLAQPDDPIVAFHFELQRFLAVLNLFGPGFTCLIERNTIGLRLALLCLDPASALKRVFDGAASAVLLSATLQPLATTRRVLGLAPQRTADVSVPPPFPREHRKIMILPQVRTHFAARAASIPTIARLLSEMAEAVPGNTLVLFPGYDFLVKTREHLSAPGLRVLAQRPGSTDAERREILEALQCRGPGTARVLLLAVMGGMFAEGVDYPGELLSAVFVVSPGLPQVSFERELLRRYFEETEAAGFDYAYLQPGMTRVIQAAGRLIRTENDRGVIALICRRFLEEPYASRLPRDWYSVSPDELVSHDPAGDIRRFFGG